MAAAASAPPSSASTASIPGSASHGSAPQRPALQTIAATGAVGSGQVVSGLVVSGHVVPGHVVPGHVVPGLVVSGLIARARELHAGGKLLAAAAAYGLLLRAAPGNLHALLGLSLIARQSAQPRAALEMAQAAVATDARSAAAWTAFGDALFSLGDHAAAQTAFRQAVALDAKLYAAHYGLGNACACQETAEGFARALSHFTAASLLAPHSPECHFACAFAHGKLGQHRAAVEAYRQAVTLRPGFAAAWLNLGVELVADGRDQFAGPCYGQAILAARQRAQPGPGKPDLAGSSLAGTEISAHLNLGHLARARQRFLQALASYLRAEELSFTRPERFVEVHIAFVYFHLEQQQFPQAWHSLHQAEACDPARKSSEVPNARGILLLAEHAVAPDPALAEAVLAEAIGAFEQAEATGHATAASNRGNALLRLGLISDALAAHQSALDRSPYHSGVRYNLALTQLRAGKFTDGWANYEIRWQFREVHPRPRQFQQPRWQGEPIWVAQSTVLSASEPPTLFLYAEQGLGDTLQFFRYLPMVAERLPGVAIVLEVQPPVLRLLAANIGQLPVQLIAAGEPVPRFTHHCPLMSLPAAFATTLETVPGATPYLHPAADASIAKCVSATSCVSATPESRLLTIGLNWAGNTRYRADRERSTTLQNFLPLLELPGIRWVSLQKGDASAQLRQLPLEFALIDAGSADRDLADTAVTIAQLDLVITTDTAIAHLAGALGKQLWLLLPWQSDWRWMQETPATPWYPTARIWRQSAPGDWPGLVRCVAEALRQLQQEHDQAARHGRS